MKTFRVLLLASTALLTANFALAQTWIQASAPSNHWAGIASSADGVKLVAVGSGQIYTSTDSGATWTSNNVPPLGWRCVASSADGSKLVVGFMAVQFTPLRIQGPPGYQTPCPPILIGVPLLPPPTAGNWQQQQIPAVAFTSRRMQEPLGR
jgi:hypothetical protein